ncbi:hypothetical protein ACLKA6_002353 [Drosophila palustris]
MAFYAVAKGRRVGIYANWAQCEEQVKGFKGAVYKKFNNRKEAEHFICPTRATGVYGSYTPDEFAVPLGQKQPPPVSWAAQQQQKNTNTEYWPGDVAEESAVTEDDIMAAMYEVEGLPEPTTSRKRKPDADTTVNSKPKLPRHASNVQEFGAFEFTIDSEGYVIVYTDGSCLGNGRKDACAGFGVYFGDDHPLNAGKPVLGRVTNNWVPGWKSRGWRLKNMEPVKNVADFKELDELLQNDNIKVKWTYVEAHKGIKGNEMADKLAKQGSHEVCCNLLPIIQIEMDKAGMHRKLNYHVQFANTIVNMRCEYMLLQPLPAAVFISTDELDDLQRLKMLNAIYPKFVDIEIITEKAKPFTVLLRGAVKSEETLTLPIHFRYHAASDKESTAKVNIGTPELYLNCPTGINGTEILIRSDKLHCLNKHECNLEEHRHRHLKADMDCSWQQVRVDYQLKSPLLAEIPVGNAKAYSTVLYATIALSWAVSIWTVLYTQSVPRRINSELNELQGKVKAI